MGRGNRTHRRAHQVLTGIEDDREGQGALGQRQADRLDQRTAPLHGKDRNQNQEGYYRKILEQ